MELEDRVDEVRGIGLKFPYRKIENELLSGQRKARVHKVDSRLIELKSYTTTMIGFRSYS